MSRLFGVLAALATVFFAAVAYATPTVRWTYSPADPYTGEAVTFDGSATTCDRTPCTYTWTDDGPDGPGGTNWTLGTGRVLTKTFSDAGTKWVRLTVRNASGQRSSAVKTITVQQGPRPGPTPTPTATATPTPSPTPSPTPTPTATPTPTPTPPPGSTCFTSPGSCGFPDPAYGTVGVPAGTTLQGSGSMTISTPGAVVDGWDISGAITVNAGPVTIRNTRITATSGCNGSTCGNSLIHLTGPYDVTVSHVELTSPTGLGGIEHGIRNTYGGTLHVDHAYQHGEVDALCHCGDATITDSYSTIHLGIPGDHLENMYVDNKTLDVERNTLINREGQTANIFMDNGNNHLTAKSNLLAGAGYSFDLCKSTGCSTSSAIITGNMFSRCGHGQEVMGGGGTWVCPSGPDAYGLFPRSGDYGRINGYPTGTTWSGNVWDDDGSTAGP